MAIGGRVALVAALVWGSAAVDMIPGTLEALRDLQALQQLAGQGTPGAGSERAAAAVDARGGADAAPLPTTCRHRAAVQHQAIVTLITNNEGYPAGALAIAASLEVLESQLRRIVLVTEAVKPQIRELLAAASWEVREVPEIRCNQVLGPQVTPDRYDLGEEYQRKKAKWVPTCTKLHAWNMTELSKVIFLDADVLVLKPIDALVHHPSAFSAAPGTFPADQFNSGVMVISPSAPRFKELLAWNDEHGTAEGGDQGLLNDFFSEWFYNAWDADEAGRLPWIMNVAAAHHQQFKVLAQMQSRDEPTVVHFVGGESKPWHYMILKYQGVEDRIPENARRLFATWDAMYWLAQSNKLCARGGVGGAERAQYAQMLHEV